MPPKRPTHPAELRRLVVIDASIAPTGALKGARNVARLARGFASTTLVLPRGSSVTAADVPEFDTVRYWPMPQVRRSTRSLAGYLPALALAGVRLRRLLGPCDVLVLNDFYLMHGLAARLSGFRGRIVTWVRIDPLRFPRPLRAMWLTGLRRSGTQMVAVSRFIADRLAALGRTAVTIYDPVDPAIAAQARTAGERTGREVVVVANIIEGKGQDHALAAFDRIARDFPEARLIFHGGDMGLDRNRAFRARLQETAQAQGLDDRIEFRGFASDIALAYRCAAAALVLSESESFSLVCLEAARLGLPVVAFRSGGPQEILVDGITGRLCDVADVAAVAQALRGLLGDPAAAHAMGARAAADVERRFSDQAYAVAVNRLLNSAGI